MLAAAFFLNLIHGTRNPRILYKTSHSNNDPPHLDRKLGSLAYTASKSDDGE